jgi:hypothetical protein
MAKKRTTRVARTARAAHSGIKPPRELSEIQPPSRNSSMEKPARIFLLSPANANGLRARMILSDRANFDLAVRLRNGGLPLGELFSFISGLYFRGKLAYAQAFGSSDGRSPHAFVITAGGGLIPPEALFTTERLREISSVAIDAAESRYRLPLERDARKLLSRMSAACEVVLLGSVATPKYVDPLLGIFGERLMFPAEFAGRGDMSRGGLMLRCARSGEQLTYVPVATAMRHGPRPPKLPKLPRQPARTPLASEALSYKS